MDYRLIGKYNKSLLEKGFNSNKDVLGTYYSKNYHRFSIMNHGNQFICFHNQNEEGHWVVIDKSEVKQNYLQAIHWVYERGMKIL